MEGLLKGICEIGVFLVCAQTVICFRPRAAYEKYLKFLVGLMVLLLIQTSVFRMFQKETGETMEQKIESFYRELEEERREALRLGNQYQEDETGGEDTAEQKEGRAEVDGISKIRIERIEINEESDGGVSKEMVSEG